MRQWLLPTGVLFCAMFMFSTNTTTGASPGGKDYAKTKSQRKKKQHVYTTTVNKAIGKAIGKYSKEQEEYQTTRNVLSLDNNQLFDSQLCMQIVGHIYITCDA